MGRKSILLLLLIVTAGGPGGGAGVSPCLAARTITSQASRDLSGIPEVSRADCLFAVALLLKGRNIPNTMPKIIDFLRSQDLVTRRELKDLDGPGTRGYASQLFMKAMDEGGGLVYRITGASERYAYQHLKFLRMVPAGGATVPMSGPELMSLLSLARKHMTRDRPAHIGARPEGGDRPGRAR
jgi:hypothetical protein